MKRFVSEILILACLYVGIFQADWSGVTLPDWIPSIITPVEPAPIAEAGYHVLIVYDNATKESLPKPQIAALDSRELRDWLKAHCDKMPDGTQGWQIVPSIAQFADDQPMFKASMAKRPSDLCVIVSNGKTGTAAPFPADEAALMTLLNKYVVAK